MTLVSHPGQLTPWAQNGAIPGDRRVLTSSDTAPGYVAGAPALGRQSDNSLFNHMHACGVYALQGGAPEWQSTTDWRAGALCTFAGALYRAPAAVAAGGTNPAVNTANWILVGGSFRLGVTSSGTFTVPIGCRRLVVTGVGGGGGGGGGDTAQTWSSGGGSGGGGAIAQTYVINCNPGDTFAMTIGAGGTAAPTPLTNGGDGGSTLFGSLTFYGAQGGQCPANATTNLRKLGGAASVNYAAITRSVADLTALDPYVSACANSPGRGGAGGAYFATNVLQTDPQLARQGGHQGLNPGGSQGKAANAYGNSGGGGGGVTGLPREVCIALGWGSPIGGTGGSTTGNGVGTTTNATQGVGYGSGGGGGAGVHVPGPSPGSAAAAGLPGALIIEWETF